MHLNYHKDDKHLEHTDPSSTLTREAAAASVSSPSLDLLIPGKHWASQICSLQTSPIRFTEQVQLETETNEIKTKFYSLKFSLTTHFS